MKKALLYSIILLSGFNLHCQTGLSGIPDIASYNHPGETIHLFTDRNLYCVNERIFLTAAYSSDSVTDSIQWSQVLYVELIKWNGDKIAHLKLKLDQTGTSGSLQIPGNLLSGNYYLRAYTKWMRNFSPEFYAYRLIKIVNPFHAEIDPGPTGITDSADCAFYMRPHAENPKRIRCSTSKIQYQPREKAEIELFIDDQSINAQNYYVSVAKVGLIDTTCLDVQSKSKVLQTARQQIEYLPEIQGMTISGKIIHKISKAPQKGRIVNLSDPANGEFLSVYLTTGNGSFIFSLPDMYGARDFFIQSEASDTELSDFLIDNGLCDLPIQLPYIVFSLSENEKRLIRDAVVNVQLNEKFLSKSDTSKTMLAIHQKPVVFYGSARHTYYTKKYIELPNVQEFFIEIVNETYVVVNNGKAEVKISGISGFSNYPPLILLDNVPMENCDRLLKLPLDKIERVEVIENAYIVSGVKYSGLISIYSKNKDFAGIDMNKNSMFFAFDAFSNLVDNSDSIPPRDMRIPDRRDLLYWNPDIQLSPGQKTTLSFFTSDNKGDYMIYISGKDSQGKKEIFGKTYFSVK